MRTFRLVIVAALTCGALLGLTGTAHAASKNCAALKSLQNKLDNIDTSGKNLTKFKDVAGEFRSAAAKAKGKLKSALNTLGTIYSSIGGGNLNDLSKLSGKSYSNALKTFTAASITCS